MISNKVIISIILVAFVFGISFEDAFAEEQIQVEVKYNNGDRADFYGMKIVVYQDFDKTIFLEKQLENNPDTITVPENHRYKIEVYANGMYAGVGYVQLENNPENITIDIPLSGGLKFNVFYQDGETPMEGARIVIKSNDGTEWNQGITNNQGETLRYWIQSTTNQNEYYIADVFLGDLFLKSQYPIKLQPGVSTDEKIITNIPEIVENLITINLYKDSTTKISPSDEKITVTLTELYGENEKTSEVNFRGEAFFDNIKSGTYTAKITPNSNDLWPELTLQIVGTTNEFNIFKVQNEKTSENSESIQIESCNCVAFRFDDVQDYWLNDVQIEFMQVFADKKIPLTAGIIADAFGEDVKMFEFIKQNQNNFEIASHGIGNTPFTEFTKEEQDTRLKQSVTSIEESLNITPKTFIPPQNRFNEDTKQVLLNNGFTHISASILHGDSPPFPLKDAELYRFPEISTTGTFDPEEYAFVGLTYEETFSQTIEGLEKYGFAVIVSHPQEFSTIINGTYTNNVNEFQISELEKLIEKIQEEDIKIVNISEISSKNIVPGWIKNNAGWWAEGAINDETFVQGIEFLVKTGIITY